MSKCEVCGTYVGGGTLCASCETLAKKQEDHDRDASDKVAPQRCACGGKVLAPALGLCEKCWREQPSGNPSHMVRGKDLYHGLPTTRPEGKYLCPCGGTVRPRVLFGGGGDFRCDACGHKFDTADNLALDKYRRLSPEQLLKKLGGKERGMFGPPRAILDLRRREGRDPRTGERRVLEPPQMDEE